MTAVAISMHDHRLTSRFSPWSVILVDWSFGDEERGTYMLGRHLRSSRDILDGSCLLHMHCNHVRWFDFTHRNRWSAHNDPTQNITVKLNLFPNPIFNAETQGIGSARITRSSKMLNPAPTYTIAVWSVHFLGRLSSQTAWTGLHWKIMRKRNTTPWIAIQEIVTRVAIRNQRCGKTRRKNSKREILVATWAIM